MAARSWAAAVAGRCLPGSTACTARWRPVCHASFRFHGSPATPLWRRCRPWAAPEKRRAQRRATRISRARDVFAAAHQFGAVITAAHFTRARDVFEPFANQTIAGFIASEVGPRAVTYGLQESARTGIPVVDAPGNRRAHPLFVMGSLGLQLRSRHATATVAVGGDAGSANYVELAIRANVATAAKVVRDRAAQGGVALAVVRNPLPAGFVHKHAAVGGLAYAHRVGRALLAALPAGAATVVPALARLMGGRVFATGRVASAALSERHGFTIGLIVIKRADGSTLCLAVCNEFMAVLEKGRPVVAFPDLIALFDCETGVPLASIEARADRMVVIFTVPRSRLILGSTMRDPRLLGQVEKLVGVRLVVS